MGKSEMMENVEAYFVNDTLSIKSNIIKSNSSDLWEGDIKLKSH